MTLRFSDTKWKLLDQVDIKDKFGIKDSLMCSMFAYSAYYLGLEA